MRESLYNNNNSSRSSSSSSSSGGGNGGGGGVVVVVVVVIVIIIIIIVIIIIALKGAVRDFYSLLTAPRTVSNTFAQVARAQSCANHVQHIERLSRATCRVTCHVVRRDSSAVKSIVTVPWLHNSFQLQPVDLPVTVVGLVCGSLNH